MIEKGKGLGMKLRELLQTWNFTPKIIIGFLLLAILFGSTQFDRVNELSDTGKRVTLKIVEKNEQGSSTVFIRGFDECAHLFSDIYESLSENDQWAYLTREQMGTPCDMLYWHHNKVGDQAVFETYNNSEKLHLHTGPECGVISVDVNGVDLGTYDLFSENWGDIEIYLPMPVDGYGITIARLEIYAVFYVVAFLAFCCIYMASQWIVKKKIGFFSCVSDWKLWLGVFLIFLLYCIVKYRRGIDRFLEYGDQLYYWANLSLDSDAFKIAREGSTFRGYLCQYIPLIMQKTGALIGKNPIYFWFAFHSLLVSSMLCYAFPSMYEVLVGKKATYLQTLLLVGLYSFFHIGGLPWVGMDGLGISCFFLGIALALKFLQKEKYVYAILSGAGFTAAVMFRSAYLYGVYGLLIVGTFYYICARSKCRNTLVGGGISMIKPVKVLAGMVMALAISLVICIPQLAANIERGVFSPFPYPGPYTDSVLGQSYDSLTTYSASISLQGLFLGQPWQISDAHTDNMLSNASIQAGTLDMPTIFHVFSNNVQDTIIYIVKKLFVGFDSKSAGNGAAYKNCTQYAVSSFYNYCVTGTALYVLLFKNKDMSRKEKMLQIVLFLTTILPLTLLHVEWRYFLVGYMLAYYMMAYRFIPSMCKMNRNDAVAELNRYLLFMPCFILLSQWASSSFYA